MEGRWREGKEERGRYMKTYLSIYLHVSTVSIYLSNPPMRPYARNLSSEVMAMPVIGPVVSSDWMISQNGLRNVMASIDERLGVRLSVSCKVYRPWMSGSCSSSWNGMEWSDE